MTLKVLIVNKPVPASKGRTLATPTAVEVVHEAEPADAYPEAAPIAEPDPDFDHEERHALERAIARKLVGELWKLTDNWMACGSEQKACAAQLIRCLVTCGATKP
jgi:hypothetical protein